MTNDPPTQSSSGDAERLDREVMESMREHGIELRRAPERTRPVTFPRADDRAEMQAARDAGLRARHETRLARAQGIEFPADGVTRTTYLHGETPEIPEEAVEAAAAIVWKEVWSEGESFTDSGAGVKRECRVSAKNILRAALPHLQPSEAETKALAETPPAGDIQATGFYYCETAGEIEALRAGGFDTCCDKPQLHVPLTRRAWDAIVAMAADQTEVNPKALAETATQLGICADVGCPGFGRCQDPDCLPARAKPLMEVANRLGYELGRKEALNEIADEMAVEQDDERLSYVTLQTDRETWGILLAAKTAASQGQPAAKETP